MANAHDLLYMIYNIRAEKAEANYFSCNTMRWDLNRFTVSQTFCFNGYTMTRTMLFYFVRFILSPWRFKSQMGRNISNVINLRVLFCFAFRVPLSFAMNAPIVQLKISVYDHNWNQLMLYSSNRMKTPTGAELIPIELLLGPSRLKWILLDIR